jgi:hypothetical protein
VSISDGKIAHACRCDRCWFQRAPSIEYKLTRGELSEVKRLVGLMVSLEDDAVDFAALLWLIGLIAQRF